MDYQKAYKLAEKINKFFSLGFDGRKMAQLSQIIINENTIIELNSCECDLQDSPDAPADWHGADCPRYRKAEVLA